MKQADFREWIKSRWSEYVSRPGNDNLAIMGLGLAGEAGEVMEEIDAIVEAQGNLEDLKLELGDVMHYATAIGYKFGIDADPAPHADIYPNLSVHVGRVLEPVKKFIRDQKDPTEKLAAALPHVLFDVELIGKMYGIDPDDIRAANVAKLTERDEQRKVVG